MSQKTMHKFLQLNVNPCKISRNVKPTWHGFNTNCKAIKNEGTESEILSVKWLKRNKLKLAEVWIVKLTELLNCVPQSY